MTEPKTIYRSDYQPLPFSITDVDMRFKFDNECTRVVTTSKVVRNDHSATKLHLDGDPSMKLVKVVIDGHETKDYHLTDTGLELTIHSDHCSLEIETEIYPHLNTRLEGLYKSATMYCTQCEAEGFRNITFFLDRPDNLARFNVRLEGDKQQFPILLANGNFVASGDLENDRHFCEWSDPFPKPSYLFACVAGRLEVVEDSFTTRSGERVLLQIYVEEKDLNKTSFAMQCIKDSMRWDEEHYGREYDLERFMVVAVDDFNMGAMENKGLNIFNTSCVLASLDTTTDKQYERVDSIIAHEYFHNWSGNRVTCRDWFQLSLKEGFTVFRDGQYTATKGSPAVKRVEDAQVIRGMQFAEDAGPMAHPIRPDSYIEINNFYTLTVYEKGAEVIGMIHRLLGAEAFRAGSDLYFERHDGTAATCDDFVAAMSDASGVCLDQFKRWYSQAGTPIVTAKSNFDGVTKRYSLTLSQSIDERFKQDYEPLVIPVSVSWVGVDGMVGEPEQVVLSQRSQVFQFDRNQPDLVPVLLREFSAPVKVEFDYSLEQLSYIVKYETDGFSRWDALQRLYLELVRSDDQASKDACERYIVEASGVVLRDDIAADLKVTILTPPSLALLAPMLDRPDPLEVQRVVDLVVDKVAAALVGECTDIVSNSITDASDMSPKSVGVRGLKSLCMQWLTRAGALDVTQLETEFGEARNISERLAVLSAMRERHTQDYRRLLAVFSQRFGHEALALNHWLACVGRTTGKGAIDYIDEHFDHSLFELANPNKVRSLLAGLAGNVELFHADDGSGYQLYASKLLELDRINPQIAARLAAPLSRFKQYDEGTAERMKKRVSWLSNETLSNDLFEIVSKSLK